MSRTMREAKLKAIFGDKYGDVLVTELGGRKRNRKKMLSDAMMESYRKGSLPSYAGGTLGKFLGHDLSRRMGTSGDPAQAAIQDRINEGALVADIIPDALHPVALPIFGLAAGGYELAKGIAGPHLPGPFRTDETSSPASTENVLAALKGFTEKSRLGGTGGLAELLRGVRR